MGGTSQATRRASGGTLSPTGTQGLEASQLRHAEGAAGLAGFESWLCRLLAGLLGWALNLSVPQFPLIYNVEVMTTPKS